MTEDDTRAELIDPKLKASGWGVIDGSKVLRNHPITAGRIQTGGKRGKLLRADYILSYKGIKLAVIEAKSSILGVGEGVAQAKLYAEKLSLDTTYATNGIEIYSICMKTGEEGLVSNFLTPDELWNKTFAVKNEWREKFSAIPFEDKNKSKPPRFYQEIAINNVLEAIANNRNRILLTLATGTGKTTIAFQIAWKLFQTRWNLKLDGSRRPRILFLADRNNLANQAYNEFSAYSAFAEDALVRIIPNEIKKTGKVPTNGSIFFTIFQTFMASATAARDGYTRSATDGDIPVPERGQAVSPAVVEGTIENVASTTAARDGYTRSATEISTIPSLEGDSSSAAEDGRKVEFHSLIDSVPTITDDIAESYNKSIGEIPVTEEVASTFPLLDCDTRSATGIDEQLTVPERGQQRSFAVVEGTPLVDAYGYMYILECFDGSFYTGSTKDLRLRLIQHQNGEGANFKALRLPVKLVYYETFDRIDDAFKREKQVQGWSRAKKIALIKGDIEELKRLASRDVASATAMRDGNTRSATGASTTPSLDSETSSATRASVTTSLDSETRSATGEENQLSVTERVQPMSAAVVEGTTIQQACYFGQYPPDYFDLIIIDECHRGGANDEGNWRGILEYFSPAVQLGLTATPKRKDNVDTYRYFGEPVYVYSLKEGINDGFLTPFKVKRIKTTLDDYIYTSDDQIIEGEIEEGRLYTEPDFNRIIEIKEREAKRVQIFIDLINQKEKTIVFCATQDHAAAIRDLINQASAGSATVGSAGSPIGKDPNYCVRVTANDGEIGEQFLREFQDNEKTIPTILTTSQKLSTGVDARNIRNIVLMRPINSMIEFKQIVGRGTRLFDGKEFFTIYDFVDAYHHFADPEWDGEPVEEDPCPKCGQNPCVCEKTPPIPCINCGRSPCICLKEPPSPCRVCGESPCVCQKKVKVKLKDGKEREIQHMVSTSFWSADGTPVSAEEFMVSLFGKLPELFKSEDELRLLWSNPLTRRTLLEKLDDAGYSKDDLQTLQQLVEMEKSDLFDVLEYVFNSDIKGMTRLERVSAAQATIFALLNEKQKEFIEFVLSKYIETGFEELDQEKLPILLTNKYQSLEDAKEVLGDTSNIKDLFIEFQKYLYEVKVA